MNSRLLCHSRWWLPLVVLALCPAVASAHVGLGAEEGIVRGLAHPLTGLDHLLAITAVGLWSAQRGGRAMWLLPSMFLLFMGAVRCWASTELPFR